MARTYFAARYYDTAQRLAETAKDLEELERRLRELERRNGHQDVADATHEALRLAFADARHAIAVWQQGGSPSERARRAEQEAL